MSKNTILVLVEGSKTEPRVLNSLKKQIFTGKSESTIVKTVFGTDIYQLWDKIKEYEYVDTFELIRESTPQNRIRLEGIERDDVDSIFLIFDYDGHATRADPDKISELLELFNDETEQGKLLLSYPMVEAILDFGEYSNRDNFTAVDLGKGYKNLVHERQLSRALTREEWKHAIIENHKKANFIVNDDYTLPSEQDEFGQEEIFENQLNKYILPQGEVGVLSAFPFFITEYFGRSILDKL